MDKTLLYLRLFTVSIHCAPEMSEIYCIGRIESFWPKFVRGLVSIFACFLIVRFVLPPWISLNFFDICIHVIILCKKNDSVSWERKKRILLEG